jgi:hypothetical protein
MNKEEEYAYNIFLYGDLFKNILHALRTQKHKKFHVPKKYKEATASAVDYFNKWEKQ